LTLKVNDRHVPRVPTRYGVNDNIIYSDIKDDGLIPYAAGAYPGFDRNSNPLN